MICISEKDWNDLCKKCDCCRYCHQDIPCGGVMSGGFCDDMCDCTEEEYPYMDMLDENNYDS